MDTDRHTEFLGWLTELALKKLPHSTKDCLVFKYCDDGDLVTLVEGMFIGILTSMIRYSLKIHKLIIAVDSFTEVKDRLAAFECIIFESRTGYIKCMYAKPSFLLPLYTLETNGEE